jgi:hypothetical protein
MFPIIQYPKKLSEFEMHANLFFRLKQEGYDVRGEVTAKNNGRKSSFDLVIFNLAGAAVIIEVKNSPCEALINGKKTRQAVKYTEYGIPLLFYTTITPLDEVVASVKEALCSI